MISNETFERGSLMNNTRTEYWQGYPIRFVEIKEGNWWAILKDVCDALGLRSAKVAERLDPDMLERVEVLGESIRPTAYEKDSNDISYVPSKDHSNITRTFRMLAVNQQGIYQALFASRKLEARKFQMWTFDVLDKLRRSVGLQEYEIMRMTEPDIQEEINWILDSLYWDEERGCIMQSVTVQGGDTDQIPFMDEEEEE